MPYVTAPIQTGADPMPHAPMPCLLIHFLRLRTCSGLRLVHVHAPAFSWLPDASHGFLAFHACPRAPLPLLPSPRADGKCGCWPNAHCYGECAQYPAYGETTYGWKYSVHVE